MKKSVFIIAFLVMIIFLGINLLIDNPEVEKPYNAGNHNYLSSQLEKNKQEYDRLRLLDPYNLDYHYSYIQFNFDIQRSTGEKRVSNQDEIFDQYIQMTNGNDLKLIDIGNYCIGLCYSKTNQFQEALIYYSLVKDSSLKYLNNSLGYVYKKTGKINKAIIYFNNEIILNGNVSEAYYNLTTTLLEEKLFSKLMQLAQQEEAYHLFPGKIKKFIALHSLNYWNYILYILAPFSYSINLSGIIGAMFILFIWFIYLRKLDVFEPEKYTYLLFTLLAGMGFSFAAFLLYDIFDFYLGFNLNGNWLNDLLYCVFGIGLIEELVKIIPLFIMIKLTKQVNETIDFIIYASVSALGFAFIENLIYFDPLSISSFHRRAFTAVILHMSLSSFIAYAIVYTETKAKYKFYTLNVFFMFFLAAFLHGLYDYWLIASGKISFFSIFSLILLYYLVYLFAKMINNALNRSEFFDGQIANDFKQLTSYLIYGLSGVILVEYILLAFRFGPSHANSSFFLTIFESYIVVLLLSQILGKIELKKRKWIPLLGRK